MHENPYEPPKEVSRPQRLPPYGRLWILLLSLAAWAAAVGMMVAVRFLPTEWVEDSTINAATSACFILGIVVMLVWAAGARPR